MTYISNHSKHNSDYRLRDLKNGLYQFHVQNGPACEGTWNSVCGAAQEMGILIEELSLAKSELLKMDHNCAEFGMYGRFLFTWTDIKRLN